MAEKINVLELLEPLENRDAGMSRWTHASYRGKKYFLKEFLDPVYPFDNTISGQQREDILKACRDFEDRHVRLYERINEASDGNIVRIEAFFRNESHYYLVMESIEDEHITYKEISKLPMKERARLCRIIAHSIAQLHAANVIHADIKDKNVLICKTKAGKYTAKIIDFDCGFLVENPPEPGSDIGGDQVYLAPEVLRFMFEEPVTLTPALDVFSLGILFHQFLSGKLPGFNAGEYDYLHEAVLNGQTAQVSAAIPEPYHSIVAGMLQGDPAKRYSAQQVCDLLKPASLKPRVDNSYFKMVTKL